MKPTPLPQQKVLRALRDKMLPTARDAEVKMVLCQPPVQAPQGIAVVPQRLALLNAPAERRTGSYLGHWPQHGLVATRTLYLGFVYEGEADFRIGVTKRMRAANPALDHRHGFSVLRLPAPSVFLIPPGVPFSDGSHIHWERPEPETARSKIMWMHVLPEGGLIHMCATRGAAHTNVPTFFVRDPRLATLAELMVDALANSTPEMGHALLVALLLRIQEAVTVREGVIVQAEGGFVGEGSHIGNADIDSGAGVVQRSRLYIQAHLSESLSVEKIALHACVSARQLNRLFRSELDTSIMKFVAERRVEAAKSLLQGTGLPVNEISQCLGYSHPSYFCNVFNEATGMTPKQFRQQSAAPAA